jgi:hypothetical protein
VFSPMPVKGSVVNSTAGSFRPGNPLSRRISNYSIQKVVVK